MVNIIKNGQNTQIGKNSENGQKGQILFFQNVEIDQNIYIGHIGEKYEISQIGQIGKNSKLSQWANYVNCPNG